MSTMTACGCESAYYGPALTELQTCSGSAFVIFMAIVDSLFRNNCKINDPCGRIVPKNPADLEAKYDFIIVGGGSGGSVVAGRLAEVYDAKVLLIEAGPDEPSAAQVPGFISFIGSSIDYQYQTEPEPVGCQQYEGHKCNVPRGKVLGGSGVLNGMMYTRPTPKDLERWVAAGNPSWTYDEVLPILKKSEDNQNIGTVVSGEVHGTGGPWTIARLNYQEPIIWDILEAAKQTGFNASDDLNDAKHVTGMSLMQTNNRNGQRLSTAKAFLRPHRSSPNLHILLNSTVTKILVEEVGGSKSAYAVEFLHNNVIYSINASKEVILSAGAIGTPQILLLSGIGDNEILTEVGIKQVHNLNGVGKGLKNHVAFNLPYTINEKDTNRLSWYSLNEYIDNSTGPLSGNGLWQLGGRISSNYTTLNDPDLQWGFTAYFPNCAYNGEFEAPANASNPTANRTVIVSVVNNHPKSTGFISLKTNSVENHPKIVANYLTNDQDAKVLLYGIRASQKLVKASILKEKHGFTSTKMEYGNCLSLYKYDSDDYWICAIKYAHTPENHQGCTCKMGSANGENCVNERLQLYGIPNIRIADASVFPSLPSGNTQCPVVLVAERAAEFIKEKHFCNSHSHSRKYKNVRVCLSK